MQDLNGTRSDRLTVELSVDPRGAAMTLAGELDLETAAVVDQHLVAVDEVRAARLLIDLRGVTFMDSSGLSSILRVHRLAESNGRTLVLRHGSPQVQRLFELTGIGNRLSFEEK